MMRAFSPARSLRRGMTLVEIMIALVLLGIVSGVIMRVVTRQQRFYQGVNQIMTQRGQLRQGISVLPVDLRSLSSVGSDFIAVSDSAIEFDMNIGTGIVCAVPGGGSTLWFPPRVTSKGESFFTLAPGINLDGDEMARGVTVYVYNDSILPGNVDDRWQKLAMATAPMDSSKTECLSSFATVADAGQWRYKLTLTDTTGAIDPAMGGGTGGPISRYVNVGAPVRIMKRVRYKLFQDTDSKWYLGYSDYDKGHGGYLPLTPVAGPFDSYATGSGSAPGFKFQFFDVEGVEITSIADAPRIARVDISARARTSSNVRAAGIQAGANQQYRDSLAVSVMLRNRQ